ncbi:hypothetical protein OG352_12300 [Streptomyces sp. NBC_01485]|nr:hypothetical protein [Streptomyces sp. NBC_01485]
MPCTDTWAFPGLPAGQGHQVVGKGYGMPAVGYEATVLVAVLNERL